MSDGGWGGDDEFDAYEGAPLTVGGSNHHLSSSDPLKKHNYHTYVPPCVGVTRLVSLHNATLPQREAHFKGGHINCITLSASIFNIRQDAPHTEMGIPASSIGGNPGTLKAMSS